MDEGRDKGWRLLVLADQPGGKRGSVIPLRLCMAPHRPERRGIAETLIGRN
jgi:hypothetical protein